MVVRTRTAVALYILNQKRANLRDLEHRFGVAIAVEADDTLTGSNYHAIERGELATGVKRDAEATPLAQDDFVTVIDEPPAEDESEDSNELSPTTKAVPPAEAGRADDRQSAGLSDEGDGARRRRRRRRRRGSDRPADESVAPGAPQPADDGLAAVAEISGDAETPVPELEVGGAERTSGRR